MKQLFLFLVILIGTSLLADKSSLPRLLELPAQTEISFANAANMWQADILPDFTRLKKFSGKDKVLHFAFSAFITYASYHFNREVLSNSHPKSINLSICLTSSLGLTKEFSDKINKDTGFSWYDLSYDLAGIGLGLVMINNMR